MVNVSIRTVEIHLSGRWLPDRLGPSGKFVENSTELLALKLPVIGSGKVQYYGF
jgi:hypothetical protein